MNKEDLVKFLSQGTPESSKRLIAYHAARILMVCQIVLTIVIAWQGLFLKVVADGVMFHPVDNGLLTAWTLGAGILAALAQQIYKKTDDAPRDGQP